MQSVQHQASKILPATVVTRFRNNWPNACRHAQYTNITTHSIHTYLSCQRYDPNSSRQVLCCSWATLNRIARAAALWTMPAEIPLRWWWMMFWVHVHLNSARESYPLPISLYQHSCLFVWHKSAQDWSICPRIALWMCKYSTLSNSLLFVSVFKVNRYYLMFWAFFFLWFPNNMNGREMQKLNLY